MSAKILLTLIGLFASNLMFGQNHSAVKLTVSITKNIKGQFPLPYSDSMKIEFDGGFANDIFMFKTGDATFTTEALETDLRIGYAGTLSIPKIKGRQQVNIYRNGNFIGHLILNKKYSSAHINNWDREITWTYINYQFIYL